MTFADVFDTEVELEFKNHASGDPLLLLEKYCEMFGVFEFSSQGQGLVSVII